MWKSTNDVFIVGFALESRDDTSAGPRVRTHEEWERTLHELLERLPEEFRFFAHDGLVEFSWWVAHDDRHDGSDNDSAVFCAKGLETEAQRALRDARLTSDTASDAHWRATGGGA